MKILAIGDTVGKPGRKAVASLVPRWKKEGKVDFCVLNGENIAGGAGLTRETVRELLESGVDVITSGDHVWDKPGFDVDIQSLPQVLRNANFPPDTPGRGAAVFQAPSGHKVGVIALEGRVFMRHHVDCPFRTVDQELSALRKETPIIVVDIHAEATSEKVALGWHLDGRASLVFGTHTHIQTADERVLPRGTAYITDCGMTGPYESVIGREIEPIIRKFMTQRHTPFALASRDVRLCGVIADIDERTGRARAIERIQIPFDGQL